MSLETPCSRRSRSCTAETLAWCITIDSLFRTYGCLEERLTDVDSTAFMDYSGG